jgi:dTDP-4-amino-4,6-dideoxygalactose transaminase
MLTVASDADAALVPGIRHNGVRAFTGERPRYWVPAMSSVDIDLEGVWPNNFCIGEAQCALGIEELGSLDEVNGTLIRQAERIRAGLADTPEITFAEVRAGYRHIYHQFVMHFEGTPNGRTRDDLLDLLTKEYRIRAIVQYYPLYRYPLFQKLGAGKQDCPVLEGWWDNSFSFPWWCGMSDDTIDYLVASLKAAIGRLKAG